MSMDNVMDQCFKIGPCPFCKNIEMHLHKTNKAFGKKLTDHYHVTCNGCAAFGPLKKTKKEAIDCWNIVSSLERLDSYRH